MNLPKVESRIKVPPGGWSFSIEDGGDAVTITIDPGSYYLTAGPTGSIRKLIEDALNAASDLSDSQPYTVEVDDDTDTSDGKVTIASDGTNFSITWTSTTLRDVLGYTGNLSGAATYESTNAAKHLWLPDAGRAPFIEHLISTSTVTMSPSGKTKGIEGNDYTVQPLEFYGVTARKVKTDLAEVVNEDWQTFWLDAVKKTRHLRYHEDRAEDDEYVPLRPLNVAEATYQTLEETANWTGEGSIWRVGPIDCLVDEDG